LGAFVHYFFFRWDQKGRNRPIDGWRALLAQILDSRKRDESLLDKFLFIKSHLSGGQQISSKQEVLDLLRVCLTAQNSEQVFIVLDGVDECSDSDQLIEDLFLYITQQSTAKLLIFSRPNTSLLHEIVPSTQQYSIGRSTSADIRLFLLMELEKLTYRGRLPKNADLEDFADRLALGADGMFLWARLMINYLDKAKSLTPAGRIKAIHRVRSPERLEDMYHRIMRQIDDGYAEDSKFARFIIMWLIHAKRTLTTNEMKHAVMICSAESDYPNFERMVLGSCACLVETFGVYNERSQKNTEAFRLIHLSAREFILNSLANTNPLYVSEIEANFQITHICLKYLMEKLPDGPLSGQVSQDASLVEVDDSLPLCNYAAVNWTKHLGRIKLAKPKSGDSDESILPKEQSRRLCDVLSRFLGRKFIVTAWIESTYLFAKILVFDGLLNWSKYHTGILGPQSENMEHPVFEDSLQFCDELRRLNDAWGEQLRKSPSCIWLESTAFSNYKHLAKSTAMTYTQISAGESNSSKYGNQQLCEISVASMDGRHVGILTILPSKYISFRTLVVSSG
jgi:hypothetical protein